MNVKKILCLALIILALVALAACQPAKDGDEYFTITYNSDGGSEVMAQSIKKNTTAIAPKDPTKEGYTFDGWYVGEDEFDFSTLLKSDITLTAKWTKTQYTVTYYDGEYIIDGMELTSYYIDTETFALPSYAKQHYNFLGWYIDAEFVTSAYSVEKGSTGNLKFYAKFAPHSYGITYYLYDGLNSGSNPPSYTIDSTFPITLSNASKAGYTFAGWFDNANYSGSPITAISEIKGDVTLYAKWDCTEHVDTDTNGKCDKCAADVEPGDIPEVNEYTITYMDGTTTLTGLTPGIYTSGQTTALPNYAKDNHDFLGWYTTATFDEGTKIESISASTTGNITLYARFQARNVIYTITYNLVGGTNNSENPTTYTDGTVFTLKNPTKAGCTFLGWYTDAEYKNHIATLNNKTGDLVLYAKWQQNSTGGIETPEHKFN